MKKRSIALIMAILAVVLCFALAACDGDKNTDGNASDGNASDGNATAGNVVSDYEEIKADGKMVVGMTIYAPMNYKDENGVLTGFDTELAELVGGGEVRFADKYLTLCDPARECLLSYFGPSAGIPLPVSRSAVQRTSVTLPSASVKISSQRTI